MNLGVYKPGQGYWVRVMSAVLGGVVLVALAAWLFGQSQVLADRLPKSTFNVGLETPASPMFALGQSVNLSTRPDALGKSQAVGTGTVARIEGTVLVLQDVKGTGQFEPSSAGVVAVAGGTGEPRSALIRRGEMRGEAPIEPGLLGGIVAGVVFIGGAGLLYWLIGLRTSTVEFLIATDFEMQRVHWSTPREILGHTWVVIGACVLLALTLFLVDTALKQGFTLINLLPDASGSAKP